MNRKWNHCYTLLKWTLPAVFRLPEIHGQFQRGGEEYHRVYVYNILAVLSVQVQGGFYNVAVECLICGQTVQVPFPATCM